MKALVKRMKSKTYWLNTLVLIGAVVEANTAILGITAPQAVIAVAVLNIMLREATREPISAK